MAKAGSQGVLSTQDTYCFICYIYIFLFLKMEGHADSKGIRLLSPTLGKNDTIVQAKFIFMVFVFPLPL